MSRDRIVLYQDAEELWRWHRQAGNYKITADSGGSYHNYDDALEQAQHQYGDSVDYITQEAEEQA